MKRSLFFACLLAFVGCAAPGDLVEPEFEGPGLAGKADGFSNIDSTEMRFGDELDGEFTRDFQYFAYEFEAREDAVIRAEVTQRGTSRSLDTTMFLYRLSATSEPSRIASDDDSGWGAFSRIDDFRLYSEGRYAFVIGTRDSQGRGNFNVSLGCLSGECAPELPAEPACATPMRDSLLRDCVREIGYESGFEIPLDEVAGLCADDAVTTAYEDHCRASGSPEWCAAGQETIVSECNRYLSTSYAANTLAGRVEDISSPEADELEAYAHESEGCGVSEDSGCGVTLNVYRYTGNVATMPELFAYVRSRFEVGPGVMAEQDLGGEGLLGIAAWYDMREPVQDIVNEAGTGTAHTGSMSDDDFQWNWGDCTADAGVVHYPDTQTFVVITSLFCAG